MNFKKMILLAQSLLLTGTLTLTCICTAETTDVVKAGETYYTETGSFPKLSVVIPVYNGKVYLYDCLGSIKNQTLKDIEIICVNDGSTDNSLKILEEIKGKDPRIKIIDKKNGGEASARQRGLEESKGTYVTFVDQDDKIACPEAYETAYNEMIAEEADIIVWGWKNFTDGNNKIIRNDCCFNEKTVFTDWYKAKTERASIYVWNKMYKKSLITENNIAFNTSLKICGDECFNMCLYPYAKKIVHIPYTFYDYRMNNNSSLFRFSFKNTFNNYRKMLSYTYEFYKERGIELSLWKKIKYFKIYKSEFIPIIKTWLGISK